MTIEKTYFYGHIPIEFEMDEAMQEDILTTFPPPKLNIDDEHIDIQNVATNTIIEARVLLNDFQIHLTKHHKQFIRARFSNHTGTINAVIWDNNGEVDVNKPLLETYSVFDIKGKVTSFNNYKSITIISLSPCEEEINPFSLLPHTAHNLQSLTIELFAYLHELASPFKEISFAAMNRFWSQFRMSPAAKGFHHNYLGGLLKHTVGLMRFARYILKMEEDHFQAIIKLIHIVEKAHKKELWHALKASEQRSQFIWKDTIDHLYEMFEGMVPLKDKMPKYDVVMTSILFHDIGKLLEYDHAGQTYDEFEFLFPTATDTDFEDRKQTGITMDELGVMVGHIPYGLLMLTKIIEDEAINVSIYDLHAMAHCILCHHGRPEWGSSVSRPQTIEGYIIHIVDYLDSRYERTETVK